MANHAVGAVALCLAACSPYGGGSFECTTNDSCGPGGVCESDGFCAFGDTTCSSGLKYGSASGPNSNQCVPLGGGDGGIADARPDSPPNELCYGTGLAVACFSTAPTGAMPISASIDTDTAACATVIGTSPGCVIAADSITVTGTVNVTGSKPLVLVAVTTIDVSGTLDASSHIGGQSGAASNATDCNAGTAPSGVHDGGAGGSFGGTGGNGGGTGTAGTTVTPTSVQGGCPGQDGGGASKGVHGDGGGAVYLIADGSISITGTIDASGAGATGGQAVQSGGGGAGAGGMIGLDSPMVSGGAIFANGGGGGEGGTAGGNPGGSGSDPTSAMTPAPGGMISASGGDGGSGAAGPAPGGMPGKTGVTGGANGGGGGGAGIVKLYRATVIMGGMVSPPPS